MFLDPKSPGEAPATQTPSLEGFIEWLEKQDPNATYDWLSCLHCAAAQYANSIGVYFVLEGKDGWPEGYASPLMSQLSFIAMPRNRDLYSYHDTFGAALHRARAIRS